MPRRGDKIGPYSLIKKLGRGTFGEVWLAEKESAVISTQFALKLPNDEDIDLEIIRREASLWKSVSGHPNILPFIEADVYDGQVVIVSQYVKDGSLADWLKENDGKAPNRDEAVRIISAILDGLEHLHNKGIVHRDLKPPNILLQDGRPRIADFGISRILKATAHSSSVTTGTPLYMPPEAFEGKRSFEADIWSVGALFQQLLTGTLPFDEPDPMALMFSILQKDPNPLPLDTPDNFRFVISKCLEKNPGERFPNIQALRDALESSSQDRSLDESVETIDRPNGLLVTQAPELDKGGNVTNDERKQTAEQAKFDSEVSVISDTDNFKTSEEPTEVIPHDSSLKPTEPSVTQQAVTSDNSKIKPQTQLTPIMQLPNIVAALGTRVPKKSFSANLFSLIVMLLSAVLISLAAFVYVQYFNFGPDDYFLRAFECPDRECRLKELNNTIASNSQFAAAYVARSFVYVLDDQYEKGLRDVDRVKAIDPKFERSLAEYNKVISKLPQNYDAFIERGVIHVEMDQLEKALSDYNRAIEIDSDNFRAYNNRSNVFRRMKKYDEAIADCDKAIELAPTEYFWLYIYRARVFTDKKQFRKAISDLNKSIAIKPENPEAFIGRGRTHQIQKKYDRAISDFTKAIELDPKKSSIFNLRGIAYGEINRHDKAILDFSKAIELSPDDEVFYYNRGIHYEWKKQYDKAISDYTKAIELNPSDADFHYRRGIAFRYLGKQKKANADFLKAKKLGRK